MLLDRLEKLMCMPKPQHPSNFTSPVASTSRGWKGILLYWNLRQSRGRLGSLRGHIFWPIRLTLVWMGDLPQPGWPGWVRSPCSFMVPVDGSPSERSFFVGFAVQCACREALMCCPLFDSLKSPGKVLHCWPGNYLASNRRIMCVGTSCMKGRGNARCRTTCALPRPFIQLVTTHRILLFEKIHSFASTGKQCHEKKCNDQKHPHGLIALLINLMINWINGIN